MQALLLCDDPDELALLGVALRRAGASVRTGERLQPALRDWQQQGADLILSALQALPPESQARQVRVHSDAPLVVVSPSASEETLCRTYEAGADLVVARPYSARLLIVQIRALMRRGPGTVISSLPYLRAGALILDPSNRAVQVEDGDPRRLTQLEFRLLYTLIMHRGQVLPTNTLIERVWGYAGEGSSDLVRGLVRRLRAKVEPDPGAPRFILTVPGMGYRLGDESA
jgi:DNA-binding response OmpR family regulator